MNKPLGRIRFLREPDGSIGMGTSWNPTKITKEERQILANELETIASNLRQDHFEIDGRFVYQNPEDVTHG